MVCHHGMFTIDGHLLAGVQNRLKHNIHVQRLGQKAAEDVELEAIRRQSNYRVEVSTMNLYTHHVTTLLIH